MIQLPIIDSDIEKYAPHKGYMLLLDEITDFDARLRTCESTVFAKVDAPFFDSKEQYIPNWVAFEYMAQTIAALSGLAKGDGEEEPRIGFIMAVREFVPKVPGFYPGQKIKIKVKETFSDNGVVAFDCTALVDEKIVVSCVINAIEPSDELMNTFKEG